MRLLKDRMFLKVTCWVLLFVIMVGANDVYGKLKLESIRKWMEEISTDNKTHLIKLTISQEKLPIEFNILIKIDGLNERISYQIEGSDQWENFELEHTTDKDSIREETQLEEVEGVLTSQIDIEHEIKEIIRNNCSKFIVDKALFSQDKMSFSFDLNWEDKIFHIKVSEIL